MTKKPEAPVVDKLKSLPDISYISTGVAELDDMIGGFARGRLTELWGSPGAGKSYLLAKTMAALSKDSKAFYIDAEFALNRNRLEELGVNLDKVDYLADGRLEQVTEKILEVVGQYDLIILDSIAKLIPNTVEGQNVGENALGLYARLIKHFEAKLKPKLARSKTAFVVINQARAGFGPMSPAKPQGGFAWEHSVDLRLKIYKGANNKIEKTEKGIKKRSGHWATIQVEKSRLTSPYLTTKFIVHY